MRTLGEWQKLVPKGEGHLMPFTIRRTKRPTYNCWHYKKCNILDTAKRTQNGMAQQWHFKKLPL